MLYTRPPKQARQASKPPSTGCSCAQHDSSSRGHRQHTPRSTTANTLHLHVSKDGSAAPSVSTGLSTRSFGLLFDAKQNSPRKSTSVGIQSHHARSAHQSCFGSSQSMPHLGHVFRGQSPNLLWLFSEYAARMLLVQSMPHACC